MCQQKSSFNLKHNKCLLPGNSFSSVFLETQRSGINRKILIEIVL